jgi:hypothetical protein
LKDEKLSKPKQAGYYTARTYWNLTASLDRSEVACKVGHYTLRIMNEADGKMRDLRLTGSAGQTYRIGPDGQIYGMDHWRYGIRRWNRDGKFMPFKATADDSTLKGRLASVPSGTTSWERDFCVDREGNIYVKHRGKKYHGRMRIAAYDRDGNFKRNVVWVVSDGALGPRLDRNGNIYIAESIKPPGRFVPRFFDGKLPDVRIDKKGSVRNQYGWMYGSIVKFPPRGGAVWFPIVDDRFVYPFDGKAKLPDDLAKVKVDTTQGDRTAVTPGTLEGASWMHYGCSFLLDMQPSHNRRCHCTGTDFDVDDFGRVFFPDQGRFRVSMLDANGNAIAHVGQYGNQDETGRPAFAWIVGVAVTNDYLYVADAFNRRVLKLRMTYGAEATCKVDQ